MHLDYSQAFTDRTQRVVRAAKLLKSSHRKKSNEFLAEGINSVEAAVATGVATQIFVTEPACSRYAGVINTAASKGVHISPITDAAAAKLSDTVTPTGIVALCKTVVQPIEEAEALDAPRLVCVAVDTADPGNAGTLIRTADAMGADCVIFAGNTVDPCSPKVVRSSAGSLFHIPIARAATVDDALRRLDSAKHEVTTCATAAQGEASLDDMGEKLTRPTAWLFGNEAHGLAPEIQERADKRVRIPIYGRAESLNLATAAAMCLYESARSQHRT